MPIRLRPTRRAVPLVLLIALGAAGRASAEPVYKDTERFETGADRAYGAARPEGSGRGPDRPARRIDGGPGYVGSDYGLGKPAFTGLGSRPDWGRGE